MANLFLPIQTSNYFLRGNDDDARPVEQWAWRRATMIMVLDEERDKELL